MKFNTVVFSALVLAVSHASALVARSTFESLLTRQTTTNACTATCAPFQATLDACTTTACLCTAATAQSLQLCINCAVNASPTVDVIASAQTLLTTFDTTCAAFTFPTLTIPGGGSTIATVPSSSATNAGPSSTVSVVLPFPTTISQIIIRPSSTTGTSSPATTTSQGTSAPSGLVGSAASKEGVTKVLVVVVGAAVGMGLLL